GDETLAPELDPRPTLGRLRADAVHGDDITPVGHGVASLDDFPGAVLVRAILLLLAWMPANRRRIEKDFRSLHRGKPRPLRVPLVPAHENADSPELRVPRLEPGVTRREVELLVVKRIVGNVHLAINAQHLAVRID